MPPAQSRFLELVDEHQGWMRAFARSLGVEAMWVDDLTQEAFMIVFQRWDEYDDTRPCGAWLRGIVRNLVANERRRSGRRSRLMSAHLSEVLSAVQAETEDVLVSAESSEALQLCLEELPPNA